MASKKIRGKRKKHRTDFLWKALVCNFALHLKTHHRGLHTKVNDNGYRHISHTSWGSSTPFAQYH